MNLVQVLPKGRFGEMISFEFHLKNRHEKTQKPLWFLGFQPRYLFRCYLLAWCAEKDIAGFFEKPACDKAFSDFLLSSLGACSRLCFSMSISIETRKRYHLVIDFLINVTLGMSGY